MGDALGRQECVLGSSWRLAQAWALQMPPELTCYPESTKTIPSLTFSDLISRSETSQSYYHHF